jgi:hypothetical protein
MATKKERLQRQIKDRRFDKTALAEKDIMNKRQHMEIRGKYKVFKKRREKKLSTQGK